MGVKPVIHVNTRQIPKPDFFHRGEYEVTVTKTIQRQALGVFDYPDKYTTTKYFTDKHDAVKYANKMKISK